VKRAQLAHVLRAASVIAKDPDIVVIGSQAILASYPDEQLPETATLSIEVDVAFRNDPDQSKADLVDGGIGEVSQFQDAYGVYGQGVAVSTATLPEGWEERLVPFTDPNAAPAQAWCLEPHDLVISKLVAGRSKDVEFARALIDAGLVDRETLLRRAEELDAAPLTKRRVREWLEKA
jgi:hypothetical protein